MISTTDLTSREEHNIVSQKFRFYNSQKIEELTLKFANTSSNRNNFSILTVEFWNLSTDTMIFQKEIGCSDIKDNENYYINFKETTVNDKDLYEIRLYGSPTIIYGTQGKLCPYFTTDIYEVLPVEINDQKQDAVLYFELK